MLSSGGMNFSLYVGLSVGTGGGVAGVSFTGRPGTSILMLNLRLYRSTSSARGWGGATGEGEEWQKWSVCLHALMPLRCLNRSVFTMYVISSDSLCCKKGVSVCLHVSHSAVCQVIQHTAQEAVSSVSIHLKSMN